MPRHKRTWMERHNTPDRRKFVLQLYDNTAITRARARAVARRQAKSDAAAEDVYLDELAEHIDMVLNFGANGATTIRHDDTTFTCYVGTHPQDKVLIVMERTINAIDWTRSQAAWWTRQVANRWLKSSGHPPLDGNDPPRPVGPSERAATATISTGRRDAQT